MKKSKSAGRRLKNSIGLSLLELSIAVAVLSAMAGVFAPVIAQGIDTIILSKAQENYTQDAIQAMNFITNNMRECTGLSTYGSSDVQFSVQNGTGRYFSFCNETSDYVCNSSDGRYRKIMFGTSASGTWKFHIIAENVKSVVYQYWLAATTGIPLAWSSNCGGCNNAKIMQIYLVIGDKDTTDNDVTLISRVYLKNNP